MLEATKNHHIKDIREAHFMGPVDKIEKLTQVAKSLGIVDVSVAIPWRVAFKEFSDEPAPSVALRGARKRESLTQKELAEKTSIPQSHISDMENGKRPIGKERAKRLGKALNISYKIFL